MLDPSTGGTRWETSAGRAAFLAGPWLLVSRAPLLVAYELATGREAWRTWLEEGLELACVSGSLALARSDTAVEARDLRARGARAWSRSLGAPRGAFDEVRASTSHVAVASTRGLAILRRDTGQPLFACRGYEPRALGHAVFLDAGQGPVALDGTGRVLWAARRPARVVAASSRCVAAAPPGPRGSGWDGSSLLVMDPRSRRAAVVPGIASLRPLAIASGVLYAQSWRGSLVALGAEGRTLWEREVPPLVAIAPRPRGVYALTEEGTLLAFAG